MPGRSQSGGAPGKGGSIQRIVWGAGLREPFSPALKMQGVQLMGKIRTAPMVKASRRMKYWGMVNFQNSPIL